MGLALTRTWPLVGLALLPVVVYYWRRGLVRAGRWRRAASLGARAALVVLVLLSLCGPTWTRPTARPLVVAVVDRSRSIATPPAAEDLDVPGAEHALLPFAASPGGRTDRNASNLALALGAARGLAPPDYCGRVALWSDGNQTDGDALAAARAASVPIAVFPLPGEPDREVYVDRVVAPAQVRRGQPVEFEAVVRSTAAGEGRLAWLADGRRLATQRERVAKGENRFRLTHTFDGQGWLTLEARLEGFPDTIAENNAAGTAVYVLPKPRALVVEDTPGAAERLAAALRSGQIDVETVAPPALPDEAAGLGRYDLIALVNVPATSLPEPRMRQIAEYVAGGGGLLVVGGDRAFTPGGYRGTPLEEALPVVCEPRTDKPRPRLALVLVIDASASMQGESIELAKQATRRAIEALGPDDRVGVIAFEDRSRWISPIHPCSDKQLVLGRIESIRAAGGTNLYPAIEKAYLALDEDFADLRHIIVLSDGISNPGDFLALSREVAAAGITISTVAVGPDAGEELLGEIAETGGGHYYYCRTADALPDVFALEAQSAGRVGITEEPVFPQPVGGQLLPGIDPGQLPVLLGYAETRAKPTASVILASKSGEPLLARSRHGRGRSVAFTSDVEPRWAAAWLTWPGFDPFWAGLARTALPRLEPEGVACDVLRIGGRGVVVIDTGSGEPPWSPPATIRVVGPHGGRAASQMVLPHQGINTLPLVAGTARKRTKNRALAVRGGENAVPLRRIAPGRYAADFPAARAGTYRVEIEAAGDGSQARRPTGVIRRGLVAGYPDELRVRPADTRLLRAIAETTGGRFQPDRALLAATAGQTVPRTTRLWPLVLVLAAVGLLVDAAVRRL